jgi:hypothetical protein
MVLMPDNLTKNVNRFNKYYFNNSIESNIFVHS